MRTSFGLPALALFSTWGGAYSLAVDAATHVNATTRVNGTTPAKAAAIFGPVVMVRCNAHIAGAHYLGWYQECMDKMAGQWGFRSAAEVGHFDDGWGCKCRYASSAPGAWKIARQHLWDAVISKDVSCSDALYLNSEIGLGVTELRFWCR
ncbi:hypothetical protein M441DRAFT_457997 [Trichoderma asperellum CBS 433.97]|uniref:Ecp2 effector protein domain-containing protein n=1 Tax=Trichoderma asperellum (strain ATCC 204424 / CBS 433.97 / NBRC 101777) TaxID=1042311 RepID=A0A2T3YQ57_TRIA4|nr:hypothetical protein M441DRAFT_457997 [Trichoderma asperellum CBS 433.97]PTB34711.1 hypothetical protein M441DRAFT_457997 [Trichoderma asperellum CBS 433.97]